MEIPDNVYEALKKMEATTDRTERAMHFTEAAVEVLYQNDHPNGAELMQKAYMKKLLFTALLERIKNDEEIRHEQN